MWKIYSLESSMVEQNYEMAETFSVQLPSKSSSSASTKSEELHKKCSGGLMAWSTTSQISQVLLYLNHGRCAYYQKSVKEDLSFQINVSLETGANVQGWCTPLITQK